MACTKIFEKIAGIDDPNISTELTVQMVEIYCEKIQDLLNPKKGQNLEVRQAADQIWVEGARKETCNSYAAIQKQIDKGDSNRSVSGTAMNKTSSRSHTVVTIEFTKKTKMGDKTAKTHSIINLVDLAGSEKQSQSKATGDRLKEANAINKSLSALGNVIKALADASTGKAKKGAFIPYRDSALTRMLQQALGGNSSTIMVCAIRPGHTYYEESLSTLRYADRAKQIKNKPTINESPQDKLIRELQEENKRLKAGLGGGGGNSDEAEKALKEAEERMRQNELKMAEMNKSYEEKLREARERDEEDERKRLEEEEARNSGRPQLLNLNADGMLDRKIFIDLSKVTSCSIGRQQPKEEDNPNLVLGGIGIQSQHAKFVTENGFTTLCPLSADSVPHCYVNGMPLTSMEPVRLRPNDRIIFGTGSAFIFRNDDNLKDASRPDNKIFPVTYEFAMEEKLKISDKEAAEAREKERKELEEKTAA